MLLSAVSVLVVAQSSLEIPEGLMNNPVDGFCNCHYALKGLMISNYMPTFNVWYSLGWCGLVLIS